MSSTNTAELQGLHILVTRPRAQAQPLAQRIEAMGAQAMIFPTLEIGETPKQEALQKAITGLPQCQIAIFISPNAVDHALPKILAQYPQLPSALSLACVGRGTAKALANHGLNSQITPNDQANSEALLAMPAMRQVENKKIVIFRGNGGREHLRNTLLARGAEVEYVECYQRSRPAADTRWLEQAVSQGRLDIITQTSGEGLRNLFAMLDPSYHSALLRLPLVVISQRIAEVAQELGYSKQVLITANASDDAMIDTIRAWHSQQKNL